MIPAPQMTQHDSYHFWQKQKPTTVKYVMLQQKLGAPRLPYDCMTPKSIKTTMCWASLGVARHGQLNHNAGKYKGNDDVVSFFQVILCYAAKSKNLVSHPVIRNLAVWSQAPQSLYFAMQTKHWKSKTSQMCHEYVCNRKRAAWMQLLVQTALNCL